MNDRVLIPKRDSAGEPLRGVNGKPMHELLSARSVGGRLWLVRYLILRRMSQVLILLLFIGTARWNWTVGDHRLLAGNLSASEFLGVVPMADPFAALQILLGGHGLESRVIIGAVLIAAFYGLLAGRGFCAWVCPLNLVTDLANWMSRKLGVRDLFRLARSTRYLVLALALLLSVLAGVAAFEWVSPISMLHRELIYGAGMGWMAVLGVFTFELFVLKDGWCGHLCPLGAFYALLGARTAQLKIRFDAASCTHCGECATVCPEPQVLNLKRATEAGMVAAGECTNCGRCGPVCPEGALRFDLRFRIHPHSGVVPDPSVRRTV